MTCEIGTNVEHAARLIRSGELVAIPTETVYGLGADALNVNAVADVFAAKERPHFDPLIVHVTDVNAAQTLCSDFPSTAVSLSGAFWPGPLTMVLQKADAVPDLVTAGLPTVAIRVPQHPVARKLLEKSDCPVAAPSANRFGHVSPTTAQHVTEQLGDRISYILDGGPCEVGVESTVIHLAGEQPIILRPGGVTQEQIEAVIGPVAVRQEGSSEKDKPQLAPGMLDRHYAPRTPLRIVDRIEHSSQQIEQGVLSFGPVEHPERFAAVEVLSESKDLTQAAARFYAALRRLDASGVQSILACEFPKTGLGVALNDRLRRASVPDCGM